jgi:hypothetical protein
MPFRLTKGRAIALNLVISAVATAGAGYAMYRLLSDGHGGIELLGLAGIPVGAVAVPLLMATRLRLSRRSPTRSALATTLGIAAAGAAAAAQILFLGLLFGFFLSYGAVNVLLAIRDTRDRNSTAEA